MILFLTALLLLLILLGTPVFAVFAALAFLGFRTLDIDLSAVIVELYRMASMPTLVAIPLFTFSGYLLAKSKMPERLVQLSRAFLGWIPGGLALMCLVTCAIFTAFTGASGVTIVALGGLLLPILVSEHYSEKFSLGLVTTSGSQGLLFPPSLAVILYGLVSAVNVDHLFLAGVLPGLLALAVLGAYCVAMGAKTQSRSPFEWVKARAALKESVWEIPLPFLILGGIYGGFFTAAEASVITAVYVLVVEVFVLKDISWRKQLPEIMEESMVTVGGIFVILGAALGLTSFLIDEQVPTKLFDMVKEFITNRWIFLIILNIFLLVVGCMMDIFSAIFVVVPLIIPVAQTFGIHPLHLAIIFLTNLEIGYSTPPVGMNLFLASYRFQKPSTELYRAIWPFLLLRLPILIVVTYFPPLSTALVKWLIK